VLPPFLYGLFTKEFSSLRLRVDEMYPGGPTVRTVQAAGCTIDIHQQVSLHMLQREKPLVQLDWKPAWTLPSHLPDLVDIDGEGRPDIHVSLDVPKDA
jgi:ubiquitin-protein ligase